jgi:hypothetical protein
LRNEEVSKFDSEALMNKILEEEKQRREKKSDERRQTDEGDDK